MSGVNNVITNIFPMLYSNKINAGAVAGVLDGFCYVGSAITAYGMGAIADTQGWNTVFWIFLAVCFLMIVLSGIYLLVTRKKRVDK
jgi:OPA family glycerol-3-phosphate transporter-like MFS transporter